MPHPLDGPRLKIARAVREVETLRGAEAAFRSEADYKIVLSEFNPETGKYVYRVRLDIAPPIEWGVWIGEVAHNLRSALDQLVWQLALLATNAPARHTQFPVLLAATSSSSGPCFDKNGKRMITSLRPEHQAVIERLQPYQPGRGGSDNALYLLSEVNNADKHRLLQVVAARAGLVTVGTWGDVDVDVAWAGLSVLEDGAKLLEAAPDVHVNPKLTPLVAFGDGCRAVQGRGVCLILDGIAKHVAEVVEGFGPEFSS